MRKWAWIASELKRLGFDYLSDGADDIDGVLYDLYPNEEDYFTQDLRVLLSYCIRNLALHDIRASLIAIRHVVVSTDFCVACRHARRLADATGKNMCEVCRFAHESGKCGMNGSLFSRFLAELDATIEVEDGCEYEKGGSGRAIYRVDPGS